MYKRIFYSLLIFIVLPLCLAAKTDPDSLFARANEQYAKGDFTEAATSYQHLIDSGYHSPELYYNLGNAYYKLNELPSAILFYEKAHKLRPGDEDIKVNLQLANSKITDKIEAVPVFFLAEWWQGFVMMFSLKTWSLLALPGLILGSCLLVVYLFSHVVRVKKTTFYSGVFLVVVGLICIFLANVQSRYFAVSKHAVVFGGVVEVKSGPGKRMKTLFVIHEGLKVSVQGKENGWLRVALPNGNIGWVKSKNVKEI